MTHLEELGVLIEKARMLQILRDQKEESLKETEKLLSIVVEQDIPMLMDSIGMRRCETEDGWEVKIGDTYYANISEANRSAAYKWLRDNGHGALIKNKVEIEFEEGKDDAACSLAESLTNQGLPVALRETIHNSRLRGFVREQKEAGINIPDAVFGIYHKREAKFRKTNNGG